MSKLIPYAKYVYAEIQENVEVKSKSNLPLIRYTSNPRAPIYTCVKGNLEGFDQYTGAFYAVESGFYDVVISAMYILNVPKNKKFINGSTSTKLISYLPQGYQEVVPFSTTNAWTSNGQSSGILAVKLPLVRDEQISISLFQENSFNMSASIYMTLSITFDRPYKLEQGYNVPYMQDSVSLRCRELYQPKPGEITFNSNILKKQVEKYKNDRSQSKFKSSSESFFPSSYKGKQPLSKRQSKGKQPLSKGKQPSPSKEKQPSPSKEEPKGWFKSVHDFFEVDV